MKIRDIIEKITDVKIYIEVKSEFCHYGFYNKDSIKTSGYINALVDNINIQYYDGKRLLVITIK